MTKEIITGKEILEFSAILILLWFCLAQHHWIQHCYNPIPGERD